MELDDRLVAAARSNVQEHGQEELVQVLHDDCMKADVSQVTVVYIFLTMFGNSMLVTKFLKGE